MQKSGKSIVLYKNMIFHVVCFVAISNVSMIQNTLKAKHARINNHLQMWDVIVGTIYLIRVVINQVLKCDENIILYKLNINIS